MKRKRHSSEQIVRKLREAEALKSQGLDLGKVCQQLGISEQTYHRWKNQYGSMPPEAVKRVKELAEENTRLKKAVADLTLDKQVLKEALDELGKA